MRLRWLFATLVLALPLSGQQPRRRPAPPPPAVERFALFARSLRKDARVPPWQVWWEFTKDVYLAVARRAERLRETAEEGPFLGRPRPADPERRPFGLDRRLHLVRPDLEWLVRHDPKSLVRAAAGYALGLLGDPRSVPALVQALGDRNSEVQDAALLGLGLIPDEAARRVLAEVARGSAQGARLLGRDRVNQQRRATACLGLGFQGAREELTALVLGNAPREVRGAAVLGLGLAGDPAAAPLLVKVLRGRNETIQIRALAATALGHLGGEAARRALLVALRDRQTDVRRAAALAVARLPLRQPAAEKLAEARRRREVLPPELRPRLDRVIAELEPRARKEAEAVAAFVQARRRALRQAVRAERELGTRGFLLVSLGLCGTAADRELLLVHLEEDVFDLRPFAALALGLLGARGEDRDGAAARALLEAFLQEGRIDHRVALALALGLRGFRDAGPAIAAEARSTKDPVRRAYYAQALALLGYREGRDLVLESLLLARRPDDLENAALALALLADAEQTQRLRARLESTEVRYETMAAAAALAFFGREADLRFLRQLIRRTDLPAATRAFIVEALGVAGDGRDPSPLADLAWGYDFYLAFHALDRTLQRKW